MISFAPRRRAGIIGVLTIRPASQYGRPSIICQGKKPGIAQAAIRCSMLSTRFPKKVTWPVCMLRALMKISVLLRCNAAISILSRKSRFIFRESDMAVNRTRLLRERIRVDGVTVKTVFR